MQTASLLRDLLISVMAVIWLLVPFAVFGIKGLLRELLAEQKRTNELLTYGPRAVVPDAPEATPIHLARRYP
jgi:hypothetical protein